MYTAYHASIRITLELLNMSELKKPSENNQINTDGGQIKETDAMGREKFWEDLGRPND
jgi:hypothetical protein